MKKTATSGVMLILISSFFYASYGIWTSLIGDFMGGYTASALRSFLVLAILIPVAVYFGKTEPLQLRQNGKLLILMTLASTLVWGVLYYSILNAGIGLSLAVNYAAITIGMMIFGAVMMSESLNVTKWISLLIGIAGLGLVFAPAIGTASAFLPLFAAFVSGLAIAINTIWAKRLTYDTTQSTIMLWTTSVFANTPMLFIFKEPLPVFELRIEYFYVFMFAVVSILASWLLLEALKSLEAGIAGLIGLTEIVFGVLFGILLFSEHITFTAAAGIGLIILAAAYPNLHKN